MSMKGQRIMEYNALLVPLIQKCDAIIDHKIKIKVTNSYGEVAKPLGIPPKGKLKGQDIWVILLGCKGCDREQSILFPYVTDPKMIELLLLKIMVQQKYFLENYCQCKETYTIGT